MQRGERQDYVISSVGVIFVIIGASKWLYDLLILNSITYWKIYLVMMLLGAVCTGYVKLERVLGKVAGRV